MLDRDINSPNDFKKIVFFYSLSWNFTVYLTKRAPGGVYDIKIPFHRGTKCKEQPTNRLIVAIRVFHRRTEFACIQILA